MSNGSQSPGAAPFVPSYRRHKPSGQAVVTVNGRDVYLGPWNTKASRAEYDRLIGEWLAAGRCLPKPDADLTIAELALRYLRFAKTYYVQGGRPTGSLDRVRVALRVLRESYAHTAARDFGPLALQAIQQRLATAGNSRRYLNYLIDTIRRVFKWAVAQELLHESVYRALTAVPGLRQGRSSAKESEPIGPVADEVVEATLPHAPAVVRDMVRFQRATGCRPGEVCAIRPGDVNTSHDPWIYTPGTHKTQYRGHKRIIFVAVVSYLNPSLMNVSAAIVPTDAPQVITVPVEMPCTNCTMLAVVTSTKKPR